MQELTAASLTLKSPRFETGALQSDLPGRLTGATKQVADVTDSERDEMHELLARYFFNASRAQFDRDLEEKEWVIVLKDETERVQGFSTLMRLHAIIDERPVVAFFSGDTIIDRDYWGETLLARLWARCVFRLAETVENAGVYWFLISSGYRTYRFLPTFFREFYPTFERPTPAATRRIIDALASMKFGREYSPRSGVVRLSNAMPLQPGVSEVTRSRLKDPHVAFFALANPGHVLGDELACLVEIRRDNLTAAGLRMLKQC